MTVEKIVPDHLLSVADRVVVVTGGARGLGYVYARSLGERGARVAICDVRPDSAQQTAEELVSFGYDVMGREVNVTDSAAVDRFFQEVVERYGRIDCLINNAGVLLRRLPEEMSESEWDLIMDVNVKGTFLCSQAAGKIMMQHGGGSIINVASIGGKVALFLRLGYCTSKAAVEHFTRVLADEWGQHNIRVNAIAPGYIKTEMNADLRADPERYQKMIDDVPLGRFGDPKDLIGTIHFLCSDASSFITGQTIYVDGGKTCH